MKTSEDFRRAYEEFMSEKADLMNRRTELENDLSEVRTKIAHLDEVIDHLAPLGSIAHMETDIMGFGLTDAIRRVLLNATDKLSAQDVRQQLEENLYDLKGLSAPMASIYKVLSRLEESGEIDRERDGGRVFFRRKASPISDEDIPF